ncbi:Osmotin thaumatin-like protein [Coniophora puteana RWD-64-598 SS2]|uniref:Osmotin thaumatin-like protein n=1 Tax=Coniophora puteana (strain RWD-64-598) TaxID=741705 RepID=R7SDN6_CONPW|nr:Osmotin thaumatin-like protein [Coniophora puteana RWD-64-598 SS2]EIW74278.1 Osmotin thaumatin-like protein [Coniophora puteana RWD-64-598 SS2]
MNYAIKLSLFAFVSDTIARSVTVQNNCSFTIWPAMYTETGAAPSYATGWEAPPDTQVTFDAPTGWRGRIWGRRDCDFSTSTGACIDGGCDGGLECSGPGSAPATLAEFALDSDEQDYVDVSVVDGFNLPLEITDSANCGTPSCPVDLNTNCPEPLQGPFDSSGAPIGCMSACEAKISGDPSNSPDCCTGNYSTPATCPPSGVQYFSYFKGNCPNALAYVYDEGSTALWVCASKPEYTVTFCPAS